MSTPQSDPDDTPLSAEALAVLARARRSFLVSIGVMIVGLMVVGGALVYRAARDPIPAAPTNYAAPAVKLPAGAEIISAVASDGEVSVTYRNGAATSIRIFNGQTGALVREIPILTE